jgi:hypothetical protein
MSFDARDLIRILKACKQAQVTELKIGDIEVKFGPGEAAELKTTRTEPPVVTETELKETESETRIVDSFVDAEDRLDLLQIDDPALYERLILERELVDNGRNEIAEH